MASGAWHGWWRRGRLAVALWLALASVSPALASDAGTRIANVAQMQYRQDGGAGVGQSNIVTLTVAERLDVALARPAPAFVPAADAATIAIALTNGGNGREAFVVGAAGANGTAIVAIDADGDGRYDATRDTLLPQGQTPAIAAGATLPLLLVVDTHALAGGGLVTVTARASTGSGMPGSVFAGAGDGGGDAVVGATGAAAALAVPVAAAATPAFSKTQVILAPDGSARPVRDAVVTYALEARFAAPADDARIDDPVPVGTRYVPGSLRLDGASLADPADAGAIHVPLGAVAAGSRHQVQFQVQIQ